MCVRAFVCVCVCACVRACIRVCVVCVLCDCGVQCLHMITASFPSTRPHAPAVMASSSLGALHV